MGMSFFFFFFSLTEGRLSEDGEIVVVGSMSDLDLDDGPGGASGRVAPLLDQHSAGAELPRDSVVFPRHSLAAEVGSLHPPLSSFPTTEASSWAAARQAKVVGKAQLLTLPASVFAIKKQWLASKRQNTLSTPMREMINVTIVLR